jgi:hypothetical protein
MATNTLFDGDAYWNDSWVQELDGDEERLYHFYITSPNLDKSGVYKQTERSVEFYVRGLGAERIREITEKFAKAKKVIRCGEWIIVPTSLKHQNYRNLPNVTASIVEYLKKLPDEVFEVLRECKYPLDLNAIRQPKGECLPHVSPMSMGRHSENGECLPIDFPMSPPCLPIDFPMSPPCLPIDAGESNLIESNSIKSNLIESESESESESEFNSKKIVVRPGTGTSDSPENGNPADATRTTTRLFEIIKAKSEKLGYHVSDAKIGEIAAFVPYPVWLTAEHSVLDLADERVRSHYPGKPEAEYERLFISTLTNWRHVLDEYPAWLEKRIKRDEAERLDRLRNTPPARCPGCGGELAMVFAGGCRCLKCFGHTVFDEDKKAWAYEKPALPPAFPKPPSAGQTSPPETDIDF